MARKPREQEGNDNSSEVFEKSYVPTTDQLDDNNPPEEDSSSENSSHEDTSPEGS